MKRREVLALVAASAVPLAGCADSPDRGGNESTTDDGAVDGAADAVSTDDTGTGGNSTDDVDGVDDSDGDPSGNDTDGQTDEQSDGQSDGGDGPSEAELAQEDVDAAQSAMQSAVDETVSQGRPYESFGTSVDARLDTFSADPIRDHLSAVMDAIAAAGEHDSTSEQDGTLAALENGVAWFRAMLDTQAPLHEAYLEAHYALQDYDAEDRSADLQAVRRAASEADGLVETMRYQFSRVLQESDVERIDALDYAAVEQQTTVLQDDLASARSVADAIETLREAGPKYQEGIQLIEDEQYYDAYDPLDEANGMYGQADGAASRLSAAYQPGASYLQCYAGNMTTASEKGSTSAAYYQSDDYNRGYDILQEARSARESALNCTLSWSA